MSNDADADRDAARALIAAGVAVLTLAAPTWGDMAPLLAVALLAPLGGGRWLLPIATAPLGIVGAEAAGLAVVAALLVSDGRSLSGRTLAIGLALLAGTGGIVAAGGLPDLTPILWVAGALVGLMASWLGLPFPGRLATVAQGTTAALGASLVWGWAPIPFPGWERMAEGFFVAGGLGMAAHLLGKLDRVGLVAGATVGGIIFTIGGWAGFALMTLFVILGVGFTRSTGHDDGQRHEVRGAPHVFANIGPAALFMLMGGLVAPHGLWMIPFAGSLAAATADTLSAELGRRWGDGPVDLFSREPVAPGSDGGVSWAGTLFGGAGALTIALAGWGFDLYPALSAVAVTIGGMAGSLADSAIGSLYERRGMIGNHRVNLLGATAGGVVALALSLPF